MPLSQAVTTLALTFLALSRNFFSRRLLSSVLTSNNRSATAGGFDTIPLTPTLVRRSSSAQPLSNCQRTCNGNSSVFMPSRATVFNANLCKRCKYSDAVSCIQLSGIDCITHTHLRHHQSVVPANEANQKLKYQRYKNRQSPVLG